MKPEKDFEPEVEYGQRDSHGLEPFIPDWDPESETKEEYEERKQREADSVLPYI